MRTQPEKRRVIARYPLLPVDSKHQVIDLNRNGKVELTKLHKHRYATRGSYSIDEPLLEIDIGRLQLLAKVRGDGDVLTSKELGEPTCSKGVKRWKPRPWVSDEFVLDKTTPTGSLLEVLKQNNPLPNQPHSDQFNWSIELGGKDGSDRASLVLSNPIPEDSAEPLEVGTHTLEELRENYEIVGVHGLSMVAEDAFAIDKNCDGAFNKTWMFGDTYRVDEPMIEARQNLAQLNSYLGANDLGPIFTKETFGEMTTFSGGGPFHGNVSYREFYDDRGVSGRTREHYKILSTDGEKKMGPTLTELAKELAGPTANRSDLTWAIDTEKLGFYVLEPRQKG